MLRSRRIRENSFCAEQLDSYLNQTRLPDELCVSDDGSEDGTIRIIEEFRRRAPFPVRLVVPAERFGSNRNFEHAVTNCSGDVILFSDQDDVWLPPHIEQLVTPIERDARIMAVASNSTYVNKQLVPTGIDTQQSERFSDAMRDATIRMSRNQFQHVLRHRVSAGHGMAFRACIFPMLVPFSRNWIYDQWVFILAAAAGFVTYSTIPLTLHRQHEHQDVANRKLELCDWADRSANRSEESERKDEDKWREILTRAREHPNVLSNPNAVVYALEQKLEFHRAPRPYPPIRSTDENNSNNPRIDNRALSPVGKGDAHVCARSVRKAWMSIAQRPLFD